eukprot:2335847-Prymnesium_polylepis.1
MRDALTPNVPCASPHPTQETAGVMTAENMLVKQSVACGVNVSVISLVDRRSNSPDESTTWTFQREIEAALYGNGYASQSGAVDRLLQRSGVGNRALPLKKTNIAGGLVTQDEFDWMNTHLGGGGCVILLSSRSTLFRQPSR